MAKGKGDVEIGYRAYEEALRLFQKPCVASMRIRCGRNTLHEWKNGSVPGGLHLARLYYSGADVIYILSGKRMEGVS